MQTKSVLTILSLALLCSSPAFSMGPRLGRLFSGATRTKVALFSGAAVGASPFVAREAMKEKNRQAELKQTAAEQEKRRRRDAKEERIATLRSLLSPTVIKEIEEAMEQKYGSDLWHDWTANDVLPEPRMKKIVNAEIEREVRKRKDTLIMNVSNHRVNTANS